MYIPESVIKQVDKASDPMDNRYFNHALSALNSLNKVTEDFYCYDDVSRAANVLERLYKGLLYAAESKNEWYQLPEQDFLNNDHDILKVLIEIRHSFPEVFPRESRDEWRATQRFLIDLRKAYSESRYETYPPYNEFCAIRRYVNQQKDYIEEYIKSGELEKSFEDTIKEDY